MTTFQKYACTLAILGTVGCSGPEGPAGSVGPTGPRGEAGSGVIPGVVSLQPARAFIGRHASIQIGAVNSNFDKDRTVLDPGDPNIKVERLSVLAPTLLQADLVIGPADPAQAETYAASGSTTSP